MRLTVRLTPRGGRDALDGWGRGPDGGVLLKARVTGPPVDGEANAALVALLARRLGVGKRAVRIVGGATARIKRIEIDGLDEAALIAILGPPVA